MLPIDINTVTIVLTIIIVGFVLDRRLNARIDELRQEMERRFREQGTLIAVMQASITTVQADISELQTSVTVMQSSIATMQADIAKMQADIAKMQIDMTELQKGQSRIEGAHEVIKDLFERAMFSSSASS